LNGEEYAWMPIGKWIRSLGQSVRDGDNRMEV
jgi:hypothetical protein